MDLLPIKFMKTCLILLTLLSSPLLAAPEKPRSGALLANTYDAKGRWTGTVTQGLGGTLEVRDQRYRLVQTVKPVR